MENENFIKPHMEIVFLSGEDVITVSPGNGIDVPSTEDGSKWE